MRDIEKRRATARAYYRKNRDKMLAAVKKWAKKNRRQINERRRNSPRWRAWFRQWKAKNRKKHAAYLTEWRKKNPRRWRLLRKRHYEKHHTLILARAKKHWASNRVGNQKRRRKYYRENRNRIIAYRKLPRVKKKVWAYAIRYHAARPNLRKKLYRKWAIKNQGKLVARRVKRESLKAVSTSLDMAGLNKFYLKCRTKKNARCHWCKKPIRKTLREIDHRIPIIRGGAHAVENLVISCKFCNRSKGAKMPKDFLAYRKVVKPILKEKRP